MERETGNGSAESRFAESQRSALGRLIEATRAAAPASLPFPDRVRVGLWALLSELAADPDMARLTLVEVQEVGSPDFRPYQDTMKQLTGMLEAAAAIAELEAMPPEPTARAVVGGLLAVISREIDGRRCANLLDLHPELVYLALVPYVEAEAAGEQMRRAREDAGGT